MRLKTIGTIVALLAGLNVAIAQSIGDMRVVSTEGQWELRHAKDSFTDRNRCVATAKGRPYIQVSLNSLDISFRGRGGVQGYKYRLDDEFPTEMKLPSKIERDLSLVTLEGHVLNRILVSKRLRIQVLTLIAGVKDEDIDLVGLNPLYAAMNQLCR